MVPKEVVMGGLLGPLLRPGARRSLVIGLGTGSTAGWVAAVPGMERTDVVELEPGVTDVARLCEPVNQSSLDNPKLALRIADAREALLTARERWDLVFSEPSNPYRAGIASLFTKEFYEAVDARLTSDGLPLEPGQAIPLDAALAAYTSGAARLTGAGWGRGVLEPGEPGDLVVWDRDLHALAPGELAAARPRWTVLAGEIVYESGQERAHATPASPGRETHA